MALKRNALVLLVTCGLLASVLLLIAASKGERSAAQAGPTVQGCVLPAPRTLAEQFSQNEGVFGLYRDHTATTTAEPANAGSNGDCAGSTSRDSTALTSTKAGASSERHEPYAVGVRMETFVDRSRPTPPNGAVPGSPSRTLPTLIVYPAKGKPDPNTERRNAAPAHGRFPLVVYAHGFAGGFESPYMHRWAAAGYIAVAPTFPLTRHDAPGGPNAADYVNEPGDVSFVISRMLHLPARDRELQQAIRPRSIAVVGASLGGPVALGVTANSCCQDPRIKAAVAIAGGCLGCRGSEAPFNGHYFTGKHVPLLLIHGTADPFVPYAGSVQVFADAPAPKFLVTLIGAPHIRFPEPWESVAARSTIDFLDRYLKHQQRGLRRLRIDASVPGVASLAQVLRTGRLHR